MPPKTRTGTLKHLQTECEINDIDPVGTIDELRERLAFWELERLVAGPPLPTPESLLEDEAQDTDTRGSGGKEEVRNEAGEGVENVSVEEEKDCEAGSSTDLSVGRGMIGRMDKLIRVIDSQMSELALLEKGIIELRERRALTRQKWDSLDHRIEGLIPLVEPYLAMRNCFISTFKRDKLRNATEEDLEIIKERTFSAKEFEGDASTDVQLYYSSRRRTDWYVFEKLYGLPAPVVKQLTHRDTITVLNTHAAILASNTQQGTETFNKLFSVFIELFEKSNYDPAYLEGNPTPVSDAYWAFIKCLKGEIAGVDSKMVD